MSFDIIEILLVEDDPGDVELIKESIRDSKIRLNLNVVSNGDDAIKFLKKEGDFNESQEPDLIILDLNLPRRSGMEVLGEVKGNEDLKHIPIIVMTTSDQDTDIIKSYKLGANSYVTKPLGIDQFAKIVSSIENFWLTVVKLPKRSL